jgi:hypothetical protein
LDDIAGKDKRQRLRKVRMLDCTLLVLLSYFGEFILHVIIVFSSVPLQLNGFMSLSFA